MIFHPPGNSPACDRESSVVPAKAGIHPVSDCAEERGMAWTPACAGVTDHMAVVIALQLLPASNHWTFLRR